MTGNAAARHAEIARRYGQKKPREPFNIAGLRIAELRRLYQARYGHVLPDDDAGRDDVLIMAYHLARGSGDAKRNITNWIALYAPWMPSGEVENLISMVVAQPLLFRADKLGVRLNLTNAERQRLRIRTIRAVDRTRAEQLAECKERKRKADRLRRQQRRRTTGARPRAEYEANSLSRSKPWAALGMSRAAWYRAGKPPAPGETVTPPETSPSPHIAC
jgi:hypothetical protein